MKKLYLMLAILGYIAPNILVAIESIETGNVLLLLHPIDTLNGMFANRIATAFVVDLLFAVLVFFIWVYQECNSIGMQKVYLVWILTLLFGMAGSLPLFLYIRESAKSGSV